MVILGPFLLPNANSGLFREARDKTSSLIAEIFVSSSSPAVNRSVKHMMKSLGIAQNNVIKIRRKKNTNKVNLKLEMK